MNEESPGASFGECQKDAKSRTRQINVCQSAERLGLTEFNTWYVRGPAKQLLEEGETRCQVYRAAEPKGPPDTRRLQDGQLVSLDGVYRGHRASHWHEPGHPEAFSVPAGPGCHHTLRRVQEHGQMLPKA